MAERKKVIKKTSYEDLIEEALDNAKSDRDRAVEAFDKTKHIYEIDPDNPDSLQGLMFLGQSIPKLLDLANKSNEQIIKLAQLREKQNARTESTKPKEEGPIKMSEVRDYMRAKTKEN